MTHNNTQKWDRTHNDTLPLSTFTIVNMTSARYLSSVHFAVTLVLLLQLIIAVAGEYIAFAKNDVSTRHGTLFLQPYDAAICSPGQNPVDRATLAALCLNVTGFFSPFATVRFTEDFDQYVKVVTVPSSCSFPGNTTSESYEWLPPGANSVIVPNPLVDFGCTVYRDVRWPSPATCQHYGDVDIDCDASPPKAGWEFALDPFVSGGKSGLVLARPFATALWGTVCARTINHLQASTLCNMLGYTKLGVFRPSVAASPLIRTDSAFLNASIGFQGPMYISEMNCKATTVWSTGRSDLDECWWQYSSGNSSRASTDTCAKGRDELVVDCDPPTSPRMTDWDTQWVRHPNYKVAFIGRLQIRPKGNTTWGEIEGIANKDVNEVQGVVICRSAGWYDGLSGNDVAWNFGMVMRPWDYDDTGVSNNQYYLTNLQCAVRPEVRDSADVPNFTHCGANYFPMANGHGHNLPLQVNCFSNWNYRLHGSESTEAYRGFLQMRPLPSAPFGYACSHSALTGYGTNGAPALLNVTAKHLCSMMGFRNESAVMWSRPLPPSVDDASRVPIYMKYLRCQYVEDPLKSLAPESGWNCEFEYQSVLSSLRTTVAAAQCDEVLYLDCAPNTVDDWTFSLSDGRHNAQGLLRTRPHLNMAHGLVCSRSYDVSAEGASMTASARDAGAQVACRSLGFHRVSQVATWVGYNSKYNPDDVPRYLAQPNCVSSVDNTSNIALCDRVIVSSNVRWTRTVYHRCQNDDNFDAFVDCYPQWQYQIQPLLSSHQFDGRPTGGLVMMRPLVVSDETQQNATIPWGGWCAEDLNPSFIADSAKVACRLLVPYFGEQIRDFTPTWSIVDAASLPRSVLDANAGIAGGTSRFGGYFRGTRCNLTRANYSALHECPLIIADDNATSCLGNTFISVSCLPSSAFAVEIVPTLYSDDLISLMVATALQPNFTRVAPPSAPTAGEVSTHDTQLVMAAPAFSAFPRGSDSAIATVIFPPTAWPDRLAPPLQRLWQETRVAKPLVGLASFGVVYAGEPQVKPTSLFPGRSLCHRSPDDMLPLFTDPDTAALATNMSRYSAYRICTSSGFIDALAARWVQAPQSVHFRNLALMPSHLRPPVGPGPVGQAASAYVSLYCPVDNSPCEYRSPPLRTDCAKSETFLQCYPSATAWRVFTNASYATISTLPLLPVISRPEPQRSTPPPPPPSPPAAPTVPLRLRRPICFEPSLYPGTLDSVFRPLVTVGLCSMAWTSDGLRMPYGLSAKSPDRRKTLRRWLKVTKQLSVLTPSSVPRSTPEHRFPFAKARLFGLRNASFGGDVLQQIQEAASRGAGGPSSVVNATMFDATALPSIMAIAAQLLSTGPDPATGAETGFTAADPDNSPLAQLGLGLYFDLAETCPSGRLLQLKCAPNSLSASLAASDSPSIGLTSSRGSTSLTISRGTGSASDSPSPSRGSVSLPTPTATASVSMSVSRRSSSESFSASRPSATRTSTQRQTVTGSESLSLTKASQSESHSDPTKSNPSPTVSGSVSDSMSLTATSSLYDTRHFVTLPQEITAGTPLVGGVAVVLLSSLSGAVPQASLNIARNIALLRMLSYCGSEYDDPPAFPENVLPFVEVPSSVRLPTPSPHQSDLSVQIDRDRATSLMSAYRGAAVGNLAVFAVLHGIALIIVTSAYLYRQRTLRRGEAGGSNPATTGSTMLSVPLLVSVARDPGTEDATPRGGNNDETDDRHEQAATVNRRAVALPTFAATAAWLRYPNTLAFLLGVAATTSLSSSTWLVYNWRYLSQPIGFLLLDGAMVAFGAVAILGFLGIGFQVFRRSPMAYAPLALTLDYRLTPTRTIRRLFIGVGGWTSNHVAGDFEAMAAAKIFRRSFGNTMADYRGKPRPQVPSDASNHVDDDDVADHEALYLFAEGSGSGFDDGNSDVSSKLSGVDGQDVSRNKAASRKRRRTLRRSKDDVKAGSDGTQSGAGSLPIPGPLNGFLGPFRHRLSHVTPYFFAVDVITSMAMAFIAGCRIWKPSIDSCYILTTLLMIVSGFTWLAGFVLWPFVAPARNVLFSFEVGCNCLSAICLLVSVSSSPSSGTNSDAASLQDGFAIAGVALATASTSISFCTSMFYAILRLILYFRKKRIKVAFRLRKERSERLYREVAARKRAESLARRAASREALEGVLADGEENPLGDPTTVNGNDMSSSPMGGGLHHHSRRKHVELDDELDDLVNDDPDGDPNGARWGRGSWDRSRMVGLQDDDEDAEQTGIVRDNHRRRGLSGLSMLLGDEDGEEDPTADTAEQRKSSRIALANGNHTVNDALDRKRRATILARKREEERRRATLSTGGPLLVVEDDDDDDQNKETGGVGKHKGGRNRSGSTWGGLFGGLLSFGRSVTAGVLGSGNNNNFRGEASSPRGAYSGGKESQVPIDDDADLTALLQRLSTSTTTGATASQKPQHRAINQNNSGSAASQNPIHGLFDAPTQRATLLDSLSDDEAPDGDDPLGAVLCSVGDPPVHATTDKERGGDM